MGMRPKPLHAWLRSTGAFRGINTEFPSCLMVDDPVDSGRQHPEAWWPAVEKLLEPA